MPTSLTVWPPFALPLTRWDLAKSGYNSKFDSLRISRPCSCESANIWIDIVMHPTLLPVVVPPKSLLNKVGSPMKEVTYEQFSIMNIQRSRSKQIIKTISYIRTRRWELYIHPYLPMRNWWKKKLLGATTLISVNICISVVGKRQGGACLKASCFKITIDIWIF